MVPSLVPCGAQFGAQHLASERLQAASVCTENEGDPKKNGDQVIAVSAIQHGTYRISQHRLASVCTSMTDTLLKYPRRGSNL